MLAHHRPHTLARRGPARAVVAGSAATAMLLAGLTAAPAQAHTPGPGTFDTHSHPGRPSPVHGQPAPTAVTPTVQLLRGRVPAAPAGYDGVDPATVAAAGYVEHEFVLSGRASAYRFTRTPGTDGHWVPALGTGRDSPRRQLRRLRRGR